MQDGTPNPNPNENHPLFFRHEPNSKLVWGILLIVGGFFFLLQQFSIFSFVSNLVWVALFAGGALFFVGWFLRNPRANWWAAIPGFTLAGLASVSLIDQFNIGALSDLSGPLFLAAIGLGFAVIFLVNPEMWWALIPGGVMMTLAVVAYVDSVGFGIDSGALLFLGLGLTFAAIGSLPGRQGKSNRWAFYPAIVLFAMGLLIAFSMDYSIQYLWPLFLIGGGLFLIGRSLLRSKQHVE